MLILLILLLTSYSDTIFPHWYFSPWSNPISVKILSCIFFLSLSFDSENFSISWTLLSGVQSLTKIISKCWYVWSWQNRSATLLLLQSKYRTCYCQYIHNTLLWARQIYCCCCCPWCWCEMEPYVPDEDLCCCSAGGGKLPRWLPSCWLDERFGPASSFISAWRSMMALV